ncbi:pro-sigmaK processing inhibitor BofA family protein [Candidatus Micrarchaeota archaeon]|nr:pro-sigmaK processing inhibitor BofA family protein [Candidatus Micrarchaeota archaeon]
MAIYIELGALLTAIAILYVLWRVVKEPFVIIGNSILGLVALGLLNVIFGLGVVINLWSLAVVGLGGFGGLILVVVLHLLGIAF